MIVLLMMKDLSKIYFIATYKASDADFFVTSTWAGVIMIP